MGEGQAMADDVHDEVFEAGISRRDLLKGAAVGAAFAAGGGSLCAAERAGAAAASADPCDGSRDVRLVNGKFVDYRGVVAEHLTIKDGRIYEVGNANLAGPC